MGPYLSLILVLCAAGWLLLGVVVHLMARSLISPPRMTDGKAMHVLRRLTPKDVGLRFEPTTFVVHDVIGGGKLTLSAWWMPFDQASDKTVLLVHGYADAKVGALAWAPLWHEMGFNILAVDLRAHGDSEGSLCTGGFAERHDLEQVVHELAIRRPAETRTLVLFGISLGAAVAAAMAALSQSHNVDISSAGSGDTEATPLIHAVVLESPFADFRSASTAHFVQLGLPGGWVARLALRWAQWLSSANYRAVRPVVLIGQMTCPLLVLAAGEDLYVGLQEAENLERAVANRPASAGPSIYRRFADVEHLMGVVDAPEAYRQAIAAFVGSVVAVQATGTLRRSAQTSQVL